MDKTDLAMQNLLKQKDPKRGVRAHSKKSASALARLQREALTSALKERSSLSLTSIIDI